MSVMIGIDFGNESCYIAGSWEKIYRERVYLVDKNFNILANEYRLLATPSYVAFIPENCIFIGVAAKNQQVANMKNTVHGCKRLLGRSYDNPSVQSELQYLPYVFVEQKHDGNIGIEVQYLNQDQVFSPEEITAMLFGKLKEIAETELKTIVEGSVIAVPTFFNIVERQSLVTCALSAGFISVHLMNDTKATALAYGIKKEDDLPNKKSAQPRIVVFVDWGQSALQVSACAFHKGKLKMLSSNSDANLGGRDIDIILATHFNNYFRSQYGVNAETDARAMGRLLLEVEEIKKQMSTISTTLTLNIECLIDYTNVQAEIKRADMEHLCAHLFERAEKLMRKFLEESKLRVDNIHSVEIVGGSSRVPAFQKLIANVFGHQPRTTLNQDEAVSRGCALKCALLNDPSLSVHYCHPNSIYDDLAYPTSLVWPTKKICRNPWRKLWIQYIKDLMLTREQACDLRYDSAASRFAHQHGKERGRNNFTNHLYIWALEYFGLLIPRNKKPTKTS